MPSRIVLVLAVIALVGCADPHVPRADRSPRPDAAEVLRDAATATLAVSSFRADVVAQTGGHHPSTVVMEYQAPDRFRLNGSDGTTSIFIGEDAYLSTKPQHFYYYPQSMPQPDLGAMMPWFEMIREAQTVSSDGQRYSYVTSHVEGVDDDVEGTVTIENGLVKTATATLTSAGVDYTFTIELSRYNDIPDIVPPPASQIRESEPLVPCDDREPADDAIACGGDPSGLASTAQPGG